MLNTLNVSQTGLNAAKTAVENVSNNIANENTPGYKKRVVQLSELEQMDARFTGRGVNSSESYRITSQYMYDKLLGESSKQHNYDELSSILGTMESLFKETEDSGFSADLNRYFQAIENLRTNPNSEVYKTTLKSQGSLLVESMQNIYEGIEKFEELERNDLQNNVDNVNRILKEIGLVNEKIGQINGPANDFLDKRDMLEKELAKFIDIDISREDGDYELSIAGVTAVRFNSNVREVKVEEVNTPQIDRYINAAGTGSGVSFSGDGFDAGDTISYKINNEFEVSVSHGESITMDWNNDGTATTDTVDDTNYVRALAHKINTNTDTKGLVTANNGTPSDPTTPGQDKYLYVESIVDGTKGNFDGVISVVETTAGVVDERNTFYKDDGQSEDSGTRVFISIFDKEVPVNSGMIKAQTDNLTSDSDNNQIKVYKDKLDALAQTLSDLSDKYIQTGTDSFIYGDATVSEEDAGTINNIGLFSGSSVMTLKFNKNAVNDLEQKDLDYLATLQWKQDISYDGQEQDPNAHDVNSLSEFFQDIKVNVASDKENNDFLLKTQKEVQNSLENSYDKLVKVDKDEEMVNLIKFQAAYTANAKIITAIDEMLQTLLGLKR